MSKRLIVAVLAIAVGLLALFFFRSGRSEDVATTTSDPETRIITYLKDNVRPGRPVYLTDLYNNVFTRDDEHDALDRLQNVFFKIPAFVAQSYMKTGKIPTLQELSNQFSLNVPGEAEILLRIMESDPRMPKFFERDASTGQITKVDVDRIAADEHFGKPLRQQ